MQSEGLHEGNHSEPFDSNFSRKQSYSVTFPIITGNPQPHHFVLTFFEYSMQITVALYVNACDPSSLIACFAINWKSHVSSHIHPLRFARR